MKRFNLVVGKRDSGKSSYLSKLNIKQGFLTLSYSKAKLELYIKDLSSSVEMSFMKRVDGVYVVNPLAISYANDVLSNIKEGDVVLDEVGLLELDKKEGFYPSLVKLIDNERVRLFISVRDTNLNRFLDEFKLEDVNIIYL